MNGLAIFQVSLGLLQGLLSTLETSGAAKASGAAKEQIDNVQAAIENLLKVQGTPETYQQLESLRVFVPW